MKKKHSNIKEYNRYDVEWWLNQIRNNTNKLRGYYLRRGLELAYTMRKYKKDFNYLDTFNELMYKMDLLDKTYSINPNAYFNPFNWFNIKLGDSPTLVKAMELFIIDNFVSVRMFEELLSLYELYKVNPDEALQQYLNNKNLFDEELYKRKSYDEYIEKMSGGNIDDFVNFSNFSSKNEKGGIILYRGKELGAVSRIGKKTKITSGKNKTRYNYKDYLKSI